MAGYPPPPGYPVGRPEEQPPPYGSRPAYQPPSIAPPAYPPSYGTPAGSQQPPPRNPPSYGQPRPNHAPPPGNNYAIPYFPQSSAPYRPYNPGGAGSAYAYPGGQMGYRGPSPMQSAFPPGTDPDIVACFQAADGDGSGFIDDKELQGALPGYKHKLFSMRTVHLLMLLFTGNNMHKIGPMEFVQVFYSLQQWRNIFEKFDVDRSGKIDALELRRALQSLGFDIPPKVLDMLISKYDKTGGMNKGIEYDNFIECCLTVKGITEKFKEKDTMSSGSATFTYESFMLTVLPLLIL